MPSALSICTINFLTISIRFFLETIPYNKSKARSLILSSLSSRHCIIRSLWACTLFGCVFNIFDIANNPKYFKFWSESSINILNFWTHNCIESEWFGIPEDIEINTAITVLIHSYNKDIADVLKNIITIINIRLKVDLKKINNTKL